MTAQSIQDFTELVAIDARNYFESPVGGVNRALENFTRKELLDWLWTGTVFNHDKLLYSENILGEVMLAGNVCNFIV